MVPSTEIGTLLIYTTRVQVSKIFFIGKFGFINIRDFFFLYTLRERSVCV
jgi:hypothetical protein